MSDPSRDDPREFSDSDREWLAALSGETPPSNARTSAAREGLALRAALEQRRQEIDADAALQAATSDAAMDEQLKEVLRGAEHRGLLAAGQPAVGVGPASNGGTSTGSAPPAAQAGQVIEFPWWRRRRTVWALVASMVLGALVVTQLVDRPDYGPPPQMLGTGKLHAVRTSAPRAAAETLAAQLRQAGLRPGIYQRGKTYMVDVSLMASERPAAAPAFKALGLEPVSPGFNRVEFSPA